MEEAKIGADLVAGDESALESILRRFGPGAAHVLRDHYRMNDADIDDVLSVSVMKIWDARSTYRKDQRLWTFFMTIARNTAIDMMRRRDDTISLDKIGDLVGEIGISQKASSEPVRTDGEWRALVRFLGTLSEDDSWILLRSADGESDRPVMSPQGKPMDSDAIRKRRHRLLKRAEDYVRDSAKRV